MQIPVVKKPTQEQVNEAISILAAELAWAEYEAEPGREIDPNEPMDYLMALCDVIDNKPYSSGAIAQLTIDFLGLPAPIEPFNTEET